MLVRELLLLGLLLSGTFSFSQEAQLASESLSDDSEVLAVAEQAMTDFAYARQDLPDSWATFCEGTRWSSAQDKEPIVLDQVVISANCKEQAFFAFGFRRLGEKILWCQHLKENGLKERKIRTGFNAKYDAKVVSDDLGFQPGTDQKVHPLVQPMDVFNMPLADFGSLASTHHVITEVFAVNQFLKKGKLLRASTGSRFVVGVWHVNSALVKVSFDKQSGMMPTWVQWQLRGPSESEPAIANGRVYSATKTLWKQYSLKEAKHWLPDRLQCVSQGAKDSTQGELDFAFRWHFGDDVKTVIPTADQRDWLTPILEKFGKTQLLQ